jgi:release factor H-coupled RctB family protein
MKSTTLKEQKVRTVEFTDGVVTKLMAVAPEIRLSELMKLSKHKFRKTSCHCVLLDKVHQKQYRIRTDEELSYALQQRHNDETPCFFFTNKIPTLAEDYLVVMQDTSVPRSAAVYFVIGNAEDCEAEAVHQLKQAASMSGVLAAIGMPDLHAGGGIPIGAAIVTARDIAYPQLVGSDIGCGMSFVETSIPAGKLTTNKLRKLAANLDSIDVPYRNVEEMKDMCEIPVQWASKHMGSLPRLANEEHYMHLGTIGNGNHFAELQEFDEILDAETIRSYGIDTHKVHLLVHSGSRSLGEEYLGHFVRQAGEQGLTKHYGHYAAQMDSPLFQEYLDNHDTALNFAVRNRQLIANRLLEQIISDQQQQLQKPVCKIDIHHNFLEQIDLSRLDVLHQMADEQGIFPKRIVTTASTQYQERHGEEQQQQERVGWIHRKGATPSSESPILVIPGSRGSLSYLVEVNVEAMHGSAYSLAHGAGRQMSRSKARTMMSDRYSQDELLQTEFGGVVVCDRKDLVYEEAPSAYKDIDSVVRCLAQEVCSESNGVGLVRILATLRPILTYKYKDPNGK